MPAFLLPIGYGLKLVVILMEKTVINLGSVSFGADGLLAVGAIENDGGGSIRVPSYLQKRVW